MYFSVSHSVLYNTKIYCFLALHKQFQPHFDSITSIEILERFDSMLLLTSSSDCSVALWDIHGRQVGVFGQVTLQNEIHLQNSIQFHFLHSHL